MDLREKTAAIATALNIALTVVKFLLYGMTGSLAILAEAWHSFADIGTSGVTFLAVRRTIRSEPKGGEAAPSDDAAESSASEEEDAAWQGEGESGARSRTLPSPEQLAATLIGLVILVAGLSVAYKVVSYEPSEIAKPLVAGIIFLVFAMGSYFVHRLEVDVGRQTGSSGLVADGMHARADMIASLLTGASLILYHIGLNVDRLIAGLIGILVLSVAIETLVNLIVGYVRGDKKYVRHYRSHEFVTELLSLRWLGSASTGLADQIGMGPRLRSAGPRIRRWVGRLAVLAVLLVWGRTCFFSVGIAEEGILERFGRPIRKQIEPGLHRKWPWPIDRVQRVETSTVQVSLIGNETDPSAFALIWTREHGTEVPFLAGDANLFYPYLVVHWRIRSAYDALYRQQDAGTLLDAVCHRVVTELSARREFYDLACTYRRQFAEDVRLAAQEQLDALSSGLEIISINLSDIHPPVFIADAFEEVVVARYQETQQMVNRAQGYQNERVPTAAGQGLRKKAEADAYQSQQVGRAQGRAKAFQRRVDALAAGREITFDRLHFETIRRSLADVGKVLIDDDVGKPDVWMGLPGPLRANVSPEQAEKLNILKEQMD